MKIVYSSEHFRHATTLALTGCPTPYLDIPTRAEAILRAVEEACIGEVIEPQDFGTEPVEAVHTAEFIAHLQTAYRATRPFYEGASPAAPDTYAARGWRHKPSGWPGRIGYFAFDATSPILEGTWEAAYRSAQCEATAADLVRKGLPAAYALCRPPGHHASNDQHGGFCYLNNAAIAANALRRWTGERVAILDIDYHHGNGTQEIFYRDPDILFCSLHVDPDLDFPSANRCHCRSTASRSAGPA